MNQQALDINTVNYREPVVADGQGIWSLVRKSGVLDLNSVYCYLILCDHYRKTCVVAEESDEMIGFVTAYLLPEDPEILFIWQVGTTRSAQGRGVAKNMILNLLLRDICNNVSRIHTTISPSNEASLALFASVAKSLGADITTQTYLDSSLFPGSDHEQEDLIVLGPFCNKK